ncbi:helix-turn-helix domain-containing protein [Ruminococcaceae bacterium OttesenSCG-928-L11]|nr:helix-turn-helix domain-containing protein [Ruminococcaceae bacterium OttesenSCG-928-L11]
MNAIVIDDQRDVVKGIVAGVNWERLGVTDVYEALSFPEAREQFAQHTIHVMLCDIEMPMGSGLEVLAWVRENYPAVECIFLTSHANFEYAKSALKLRSFDYILQPVKYAELEEVIARAIDKIIREQQKEELSEYGSYWRENREALLDTTLKQAILDPAFSQRSGIDLSRLHQAMTVDSQVFPILIAVLRQHTQLADWDEAMLKYALSNILNEITGQCYETVGLSDGRYMAILLPQGNVAEEPVLLSQIRIFRIACGEYLKCSVACYIGALTAVNELHGMYLRLAELEKRNVARYSRTYTLESGEQHGQELHIPRMKVWEEMLARGVYQEVAVDMEAFLDDMVKAQTLDADYLYSFHRELVRLIYGVLGRLRRENRREQKGKMDFVRMANASESVEKMVEFIAYAMDLLAEESREEAPDDTEPAQKVTELVTEYISRNIGREISRNELADLVFLSPEYLSRLFKKEMGVSLSEYMIQEKMKLAQYLLRESDLSVSLIASKTGYTSFSHFSQLFKRVTGMSPLEFRNNGK